VKDLNYTVERCKSGLSAAITLQTDQRPKFRDMYAKMERDWREQLAHAEAREACGVQPHDGPLYATIKGDDHA
jgi:hypothetical protein